MKKLQNIFSMNAGNLEPVVREDGEPSRVPCARAPSCSAAAPESSAGARPPAHRFAQPSRGRRAEVHAERTARHPDELLSEIGRIVQTWAKDCSYFEPF